MQKVTKFIKKISKYYFFFILFKTFQIIHLIKKLESEKTDDVIYILQRDYNEDVRTKFAV